MRVLARVCIAHVSIAVFDRVLNIILIHVEILSDVIIVCYSILYVCS